MKTRKELAWQTYKIIRDDLGNEITEKEVWQRIAESSDDVLLNFVYEKEKEK